MEMTELTRDQNSIKEWIDMVRIAVLLQYDNEILAVIRIVPGCGLKC